jgi:ureidoglycolate lyase
MKTPRCPDNWLQIGVELLGERHRKLTGDQKMIITAKPLTPLSFKPFGQVIIGSGKIPERIPFAAKVENHRLDAKLNITYMRINPKDGPIHINLMEKHPYSHQIFIPLNGTRHLVVVCPSDKDGAPYWTELLAFTAEGSQVVNYYAGTWHAPRTSIGGPGEFVMLRWDDGTEDDEKFYKLATEIEIDLE